LLPISPNTRRVDRNKHCFMKYRGSETQRRVERKRESKNKLYLIFFVPLCLCVKTHRLIIPSSYPL